MDRNRSFGNPDVPSWYSKEKEPVPHQGVNKGLTLVLDAHSDKLAVSSVLEDFQVFKKDSLLWVFFYFFAVNWTVGVFVIVVFVSITNLIFEQKMFLETSSTYPFSRNLQKSLRRFFKFCFFSCSELDFPSMQGFMAIVTNSDSYPLTALKNLRIKPGHDNLVALKAVDVQADK